MTKRGTLYDAHAAGLQHDNYPEIPDDATYFAVVRNQMYGISAVTDEWVPELAPHDLLDDFKEAADELGHNEAWEAVDFEARFRAYLRESEAAQASLDRVRALLDVGEDVVLVCYENTDDKRCHREILVDVLTEGSE